MASAARVKSRSWIDRPGERQVGVELHRCDWFRHARVDRRPGMLDLPAEGLRDYPGHDIHRRPVERVVETDARGVGGGVRVRRIEIPEDRKGRRLPGVVERVKVIGGTATSGDGIERGEREIRRRRTCGSRDLGCTGGSRNAGIRAQELRAADPLRGVLVAAQAERLIVDRPYAFGSGVRGGEKGQPFEHLLALVERRVGVYQRKKVLQLQRKGADDPEFFARHTLHRS